MRQRIIKEMTFPYEGMFAQIAAKCSGKKLWKDGIRFVRPQIIKLSAN